MVGIQLWRDESGAVITVELVLVTTIVVIGAMTGLAAVKEAIVTELADIADAIGTLDQSYSIAGVRGFSSFTAGSEYIDIRDRGDEPGAVGTPRGIVVAASAFLGPIPSNEGGLGTGRRGLRVASEIGRR